jgi:hypothetical protein
MKKPNYVPVEVPNPDKYFRFNQLLAEVSALHNKKGADYEGSGPAYANLRAAEAFGVAAWKYAFLRIEEKMRRIKAYSQGSTLQNEGVRDSMLDVAVLALIGLLLWEETQNPVLPKGGPP